MRLCKLVGSLASLSLPLAAQTFLVDQANGAGTSFTTIAAAVAAVPDGSTLLVRQGGYAGFTVSGRGITILADANVYIGSSVVVTSTSSAQRVVLAGLRFLGTATSGNGSVLEIAACAGAVCVDGCYWQDVTLTIPVAYNFPPAIVLITGCQQVMFHRGAASFCRVEQSHVTFEGTTLTGVDTQVSLTGVLVGTAGLQITGGDVQVAGGLVTGGLGDLGIFSDRYAIESAGDLRLLGGVIVRAGCCRNTGAPAIYNTGTIHLDASAVLQPSRGLPIVGQGFVSNESLPAVTSASAAPGGVLTSSTPFPVGAVTALLLGFPGPRVTAPGFVGELWLDPSLPFVVVAFGASPVSANVSVPNSAQFLGTVLAWQSVVFDNGLFELSNGSWALVR